MALEDSSGGGGGGGGRVIMLWSENAPAKVHAAAKAMLGSTSTVLARNPRAYDSSDGNFAWVLPVQGPSASQLSSNWGEQYLKDFEWGMANHWDYLKDMPAASANTLSVGAVYPGFDDSKVPAEWNGGTTRRIAQVCRSLFLLTVRPQISVFALNSLFALN